MQGKRRKELLAYASVCFRNCTSPFERIHLIQKNVTADECFELSNLIADILTRFGNLDTNTLFQAQLAFNESQEKI